MVRDAERCREIERDAERWREMQRDAERCREIEKDGEKSREMQRDAEKWREMKRDGERCREMERNAERWREIERDEFVGRWIFLHFDVIKKNLDCKERFKLNCTLLSLTCTLHHPGLIEKIQNLKIFFSEKASENVSKLV